MISTCAIISYIGRKNEVAYAHVSRKKSGVVSSFV